MKFFQSNNITLICLCDKFQLWKALKMVGLQGSIPYMGIVWSLCQSEESVTLFQYNYKLFPSSGYSTCHLKHTCTPPSQSVGGQKDNIQADGMRAFPCSQDCTYTPRWQPRYYNNNVNIYLIKFEALPLCRRPAQQPSCRGRRQPPSHRRPG